MLGSKTQRNFFVYLLHHGARYLLPLILTPFLARMLRPDQFGDFVVWNACVWTSSLLMEFGFYVYAVNRTAVAKDVDTLRATVSTIVNAKLMLAPAAVTVYALATFGLGFASRQPAATVLGLFAVLSYGGSFAWYFQGRERGTTAVLVEAIPQVMQLALVLAFVRNPADLWMAVLFQTLAGMFALGASVVVVWHDDMLLAGKPRDGAKAIVEAMPFFVERCSYTIYSTAAPIIISLLTTREEAAFYGIGDKVGVFLIGFSIPLTQAMAPVVVRRLSVNTMDWALSLRLVILATAFTGSIALLVFFTIEPVLVWFFGESYRPAVAVARWFCVSSVLMAYQLTLSRFVIIPGGGARILMITSGIALAVSLSLQFLLVPSMGAAGSAIGRTVAEFSMGAILTVAAWRFIRRDGAGQLAPEESRVQA